MYKSQASGVCAPFLPLSVGAAWGKKSFLSFPTATAFVQALILFCLGYGNSFLFPFIYPLVCSCQSDISTMHVWILSLPSFNCQGFPAACRMKSKLLFPAFWACCSQIPNCFSRQASTSVWSVPWLVCSFRVRCSCWSFRQLALLPLFCLINSF